MSDNLDCLTWHRMGQILECIQKTGRGPDDMKSNESVAVASSEFVAVATEIVGGLTCNVLRLTKAGEELMAEYVAERTPYSASFVS